jgi:hypothetical protein
VDCNGSTASENVLPLLPSLISTLRTSNRLDSLYCSLDTSEYMRNGDYTPTRLGAQYDAVTVLINNKVLQHPENTVGVLAFGGKNIKLLTSPTEDIGKLLAVLTDLRPEGDSGFVAGFKTAVVRCIIVWTGPPA